MGLFWNYIRKQLRFRTALSGGPVAVLLQGIGRAFDDVHTDILWSRDQMNPKTCDDALVRGFARSRGIERHPAESFDQYRSRVVSAWAWHRLAGRHQGVERILDHYGHTGCTVTSMKPEDNDKWAEFQVAVPTDTSMNESDYDAIRSVVNGAKAAAAKLARLNVQSRTPIPCHVGAGVRFQTHIRLKMTTQSRTPTSSHVGAGLRFQSHIRL